MGKSLSRFIAVDGEALETGEYVLLCASTGDTLVNLDGISTLQAFEFLLSLKARNPHSILVAFGMNYDVNMILRDVHRAKLTALWNTNTCEWRSPDGTYYRLEWIAGKRFRIGTGSKRLDTFRGVTISEVFGFFQTSFVTALESWNIADEDGALERIVSGKAERGGFQASELPEITRYCLAECRMLVALMNELRRVFYSAGIRPQSWNGAGAAAAAALRRHNVKAYHRSDEDLPRPLRNAIMSAYYGGRSEVFWQGLVGDCVGYDINSAYPAEATRLPSLLGVWQRVTTYDPLHPFAIWDVEWETNYNAPVQPFPYRSRKEITYPYAGRGWYWADEVRSAMALHGESIRVLRGYTYHPDTSAHPFDFVHDYFSLKREAKREGRAEEKAYKLALNSLYGKLAQGTGYNDTVPWQRSYVWAGMITSGTRARLLQIAANAPESVVFMATDGIVFLREGAPALATGKELGELERSEYPNLFVAQSGIYYATDDDGTEVFKCRGLFKQEVHFDKLIAGWREYGPYYSDPTEGRRFVGLGTALMRTDPPRWEIWRSWPLMTRRIKLHPDRKFVDHSLADSLLLREIPVPDRVRWVAPEGSSAIASDPYKPKTAGTPADADPEYVQAFDQPYLAVDDG